jgi:hypothetical protein
MPTQEQQRQTQGETEMARNRDEETERTGNGTGTPDLTPSRAALALPNGRDNGRMGSGERQRASGTEEGEGPTDHTERYFLNSLPAMSREARREKLRQFRQWQAVDTTINKEKMELLRRNREELQKKLNESGEAGQRAVEQEEKEEVATNRNPRETGSTLFDGNTTETSTMVTPTSQLATTSRRVQDEESRRLRVHRELNRLDMSPNGAAGETVSMTSTPGTGSYRRGASAGTRSVSRTGRHIGESEGSSTDPGGSSRLGTARGAVTRWGPSATGTDRSRRDQREGIRVVGRNRQSSRRGTCTEEEASEQGDGPKEGGPPPQ